MNTNIFKEKVTKATDEVECDQLAIQWLRDVAKDHGKEGAMADKLLDIVAELLDIDA
jgi:hypothetical protein